MALRERKQHMNCTSEYAGAGGITALAAAIEYLAAIKQCGIREVAK
ncbi:hypothetical protein GCM10022206_03300 [Streptomyces chiangmaiensis]